jgi:hypothetical protein
VLRSKNDSELEDAILRTLSYFDIFNYPLKVSEIFNFLQLKVNQSELQDALSEMAANGQIYVNGDLFSLQSPLPIFERRQKGNALADSLLPKVKEKANLIFQFPFVRSVMASGSFSKNYMDDTSDFDFFIICAPQRIWISRMLLVLYKKLFLKNSHRYFCINYFIDESNLAIDEKNIFTATELATVLPLTGRYHYEQLIKANHEWILSTFPNFERQRASDESPQASAFKNLFEIVINIFFGTNINYLFKRLTLRRWKKTYAHLYSPGDFEIAFKSTDSVSKNHPRNFQKRIIEEFQKRVNRATKKVEVYE